MRLFHVHHCLHTLHQRKILVTVSVEHKVDGTKYNTESRTTIWVYKCCKCPQLGYAYRDDDHFDGNCILVDLKRQRLEDVPRHVSAQPEPQVQEAPDTPKSVVLNPEVLLGTVEEKVTS